MNATKRTPHYRKVDVLRDMYAEVREERDRLRAENAELREALEFIEQQSSALKPLWEKGIDSPERKHNEARNHILAAARAALDKAGRTAAT